MTRNCKPWGASVPHYIGTTIMVIKYDVFQYFVNFGKYGDYKCIATYDTLEQALSRIERLKQQSSFGVPYYKERIC